MSLIVFVSKTERVYILGEVVRVAELIKGIVRFRHYLSPGVNIRRVHPKSHHNCARNELRHPLLSA